MRDIPTPDAADGSAPASSPRESARVRALAALDALPGPLAGAVMAVVVAEPYGTPVESSFVCFFTLLMAGAVADRRSRFSALLPMMGALARIAGPVAGVALLSLLEVFTTLPGVGARGLTLIGVAASIGTIAGELAARRLRHPSRIVRIGVIGPVHAADSLARELAGSRNRDFQVTGRIAPNGEPAGQSGEIATLGPLDRLGELADAHQIDLLLMSADVPRLAVFDEISRSCLHLPVRLQELAGFYEDTFGHVPVAEINAAWFQYIMHPRYRHSSPALQRALDIVVGSVAAVVLAPLLAALAVLVRRDGGPAFFCQERIGEGGTPFTIWKLRTMRSGVSSDWAGQDDLRVTRLGRILRRSHLDELPQLLNIVRGDMSLVGPRPEQPHFVEQLEGSVPFYSRRHLVKPGLTGWAQVRCGYAGSEIGSAWKVSHDLFYLKHRSMWLNLMIMGETLRTLVADRQYTAQPHTVAFILSSEPSGAVTAMPDPAQWASTSGVAAVNEA